MPTPTPRPKAQGAGTSQKFVLSNGQTDNLIPLEGRVEIVASSGARYRIRQQAGAASKPVDTLIALADGASGRADLRLLLDDDTEVIIRDFYRVDDVQLSIPRADGKVTVIDRSSPSLAVGADMRDIVLLNGSESALTALARAYAGQFQVLSPTTLSNALIWSDHAAPALGQTGQSATSFLQSVSFGAIDAKSGLGLLAGLGAVGAGIGLASSSSSSSSSSRPDSPTGANSKPVLSVAPIAKDNRINASEATAAVVISGTASHVEDGQVVTVTWAGLTRTSIVAGGTWSVAVEAKDIPADGAHKITVSATNREGQSTEIVGDLPVGRREPTIRLTTSALTKNAVTNGGTLTGTTDLPDGASLTVTLGTVSKTATVSAGTWSVAFAATDIPANATNVAVTIQGFDSFGNQGLAFNTLLVDRTASLSIDAPTADGAINGRERTNALTLTGNATGIEEGQSVTVSFNGVTHTAVIARSGTDASPVFKWAVTFAANEIPARDGVYPVTVTASDKAGNTATQTLNVPVATIFASDAANASPGLVLNGDKANDNAGAFVAWAGDVNGDGFDDLIVSAPDADPAGQTSAGRSYIVFGGTASTALDLAALGSGNGGPKGFSIDGRATGDGLGFAVAALGDINGDGRSDVIVTAPFSDLDAPDSGRAYIIFGKTSGDALSLSSLAQSQGFAIAGMSSGDKLGMSAAAIGDVNGDGYADFLLGAPGANGGNGRAYVVFGSSAMTGVQLSAVAAGTGGFVIDGSSAVPGLGSHVAGIGDIDGDGLADILISGSSAANAAYVVFGRTVAANINVGALDAGSGGFAITGNTGQMIGLSVAGVGDVNGDGYADYAVGTSGTGLAGRNYVIFGASNSGAVNLSSLASGNKGFSIAGASANEHAGFVLGYAGDINGDGLADLIVGAPASDVTGTNAGRAYVVFGKTSSTPVELSALAASDGFAISGIAAETDTGASVGYAGDVNGDGLDDLIASSPGSTVDQTKSAGQAFVIFGSTDAAFVTSQVDILGTSGNDTLGDNGAPRSIVAALGNDEITLTGGSTAYGGGGNDVFKIGGAVLASLTAPLGSNSNRSGLHGGSGVDKVTVTDSGVTLDLTALGFSNSSVPSHSGRLSSIEHVDITGPSGANNTLKLNLGAVVGITEDRAVAGQPAPHTLFVTGDSGDALTLTDAASWANTGTYVDAASGINYQILQHATGAAALYYAAAMTIA